MSVPYKWHWCTEYNWRKRKKRHESEKGQSGKHVLFFHPTSVAFRCNPFFVSFVDMLHGRLFWTVYTSCCSLYFFLVIGFSLAYFTSNPLPIFYQYNFVYESNGFETLSLSFLFWDCLFWFCTILLGQIICLAWMHRYETSQEKERRTKRQDTGQRWDVMPVLEYGVF